MSYMEAMIKYRILLVANVNDLWFPINFQHKQSKKKGAKSSGPEPPPSSNLNVLEEELMSKINANVKLNEMVRFHTGEC